MAFIKKIIDFIKFKNKKEQLYKSNKKEILLEILKCIVNEDKSILEEIERCTKNPLTYYEIHKSRYEDRGIEKDDEIDKIQWIGMIDCLLENNYVVELDFKCEKEDFISLFKETKGFRKNGLFINSSLLNSEEYITEWCKALDEEWKDKGLCIIALDINSDSYIIFVGELKILYTLGDLAQKIDQRISLAQKM